jgi:hypothetical protein
MSAFDPKCLVSATMLVVNSDVPAPIGLSRLLWAVFLLAGFIASTAMAVRFYTTDRPFQGDGMAFAAIFFLAVGWKYSRR